MTKIKLLVAPLLALPLIASCSNAETTYKISIPDTNGVVVTPNTVTKGKDYVGTIKIAQDVAPESLLPSVLDKVTSGNKELKASDDYTYTLKEDKLSADFKIPAANIVGDIQITLSLDSKPTNPISEEITKIEDGLYSMTFRDDYVEKYLVDGGGDEDIDILNFAKKNISDDEILDLYEPILHR